MTESLKCTKVVTVHDGKKTYHERCGKPAAEYTLKGLLSSATATLCVSHKLMAEAECERQAKGIKPGKPKPIDPRQTLIPMP